MQGVKAYWIIVSSTPFDIVTDENDEISIEEANLEWRYTTTETSAQYGDIYPDSPYQSEAPPLNPNDEFSYAILNLYEANNPVYASPVFGGVIPMTYVNENPISNPGLISPDSGKVFRAAENITFRWTEVVEAVGYTVILYEVISQEGVDAAVPIWSVNTNQYACRLPRPGFTQGL